MREVALYARDGGIRAVARIDDEDFERLCTHRWKLTTKGYAQREEYRDGSWRSVRMHRVVMGLERGDVRQVDHLNGDRLDNRKSNLRVIGPQFQQQNVRRRKGLRGLRQRPSGRWEVRVRQQQVGTFDTYEEATAAAVAARRRELPYALD